MRKILLAAALLLASTYSWAELQQATFAGGCFWCMEPPFDGLPGVRSTVSGYTGGHIVDPTYEQVSAGNTGHQEVVQVTFDDEEISYRDLLEVFWRNVDPLDDGGQFCDRGDSYLSGIFYHNEKQKTLAISSREKIARGFEQAVVTFIKPLGVFYPAEDYHQNYYQENPIRYKYYRYRCGRDDRLDVVWGRP